MNEDVQVMSLQEVIDTVLSSHSLSWLCLALALVGFLAVCLCAGLLYRSVQSEVPLASLRARNILTANERHFLRCLQHALPECEVWPQVAMAALIETQLPRAHPCHFAARRLFYAKIVDYVVCQPDSVELLAVVELDDRTHDASLDEQRDALLARVGIRTVRFASTAKPSTADIRRQLLWNPALAGESR